MTLQSFREKINLFLYSSKERNLRILRYISFFVSISAITTLIVYYGFPLHLEIKTVLTRIIQGSFAFYVINYLIKFLYNFEPSKYLKNSWFEGLLLLLILIDGISSFLLNSSISHTIFSLSGIKAVTPIYILFTQLYLLLIVSIDLGTAAGKFQRMKISPNLLFIYSFIVLILGGAALLMLPEMTKTKASMPFVDALFTSASASCVTGLIVVDTASYFSYKGQFVIMLLMQIGGLSIISFAAFFNFLSSGGVGIKQQSLMQNVLSSESLASAKSLLKEIIYLTFIIEILGSFLIFSLWGTEIQFHSLFEKIYFSIFHSVSAFNNAGFSLFQNGLYQKGVENAYILHLVIAALIILGGLGFSTIRDVFGINNLRERMQLPWKKLKLSSQVAVYSSIVLLLIGTVVFFFLEHNNTLQDKKFVEKVITAFFQSATSRTAGFNTVDVAKLSVPVLLLFILLMFIGGSSGSTAGGIKTSTFSLMILSAKATITGKRSLEIGRYSIGNDLLNRAFSIFLFASGIIFIGSFILSISDPQFPILNLVFEEVSAFATVGLSTGLTSSLSLTGKVVIILSMFIGRVGILTLVFSLTKKVISRNYKYPNAHMMVG